MHSAGPYEGTSAGPNEVIFAQVPNHRLSKLFRPCTNEKTWLLVIKLS